MLSPNELSAIRRQDVNLFNLLLTVISSINLTGKNAGLDPRPAAQTDPAFALPPPLGPAEFIGAAFGEVVLVLITPGAGTLESALYFVEVATVDTFPSVQTFALGHALFAVIPLTAGTYYLRSCAKYQMSGKSVYSLPIELTTTSGGGGGGGWDVSARVARSTAQSLANNTHDPLSWETAQYQSGGTLWVIGAPTNIVVPADGVYQVEGEVVFAANATGFRMTGVKLNSTFKAFNIQLAPSGSIDTHLPVGAQFKAVTNDVIQLTGFQNSGAGLNAVVNSDWSPRLSVAKVATG